MSMRRCLTWISPPSVMTTEMGPFSVDASCTVRMPNTTSPRMKTGSPWLEIRRMNLPTRDGIGQLAALPVDMELTQTRASFATLPGRGDIRPVELPTVEPSSSPADGKPADGVPVVKRERPKELT